MNRPARRFPLQFTHPPEYVTVALLVRRGSETVVRREAVVDHLACPVDTNQPLQGIHLAATVNGIAGGTLGHPDVQPRRSPPDTPARLVRRQHRRRLDLRPYLLVRRPQALPGPQYNGGAAAARQRDPE